MHNQYRAKHQVGPLSWDDSLQNTAQNWADGCVFEHSHGQYGEYLAKGHQSFEQAVMDWYNEVSILQHLFATSIAADISLLQT